MAILQTSPLLLEVGQITNSAGSPYFKVTSMIRCGDKEFAPLNVLRLDTDANYRTSYMDLLSLVVVVGKGTLLKDIAPFQDDIKITITKVPLGVNGAVLTNKDIHIRTYRAYLGDEVPRAMDNASDLTYTDKSSGDLSGTTTLTFILEEVAIEQLRRMSYGFVARSCPPYMVLKTMISRACQALKLDMAESVTGLDMVQANNNTPRDHIVVKDGTPLLELPDLLQNDQGGLYSSCLGFYIVGKFVYAWPLYDTSRQATAKRLLRVILSPTKFTASLDRTWKDDGRTLTVLSSGKTTMIDDTVGQLNTKGNAVRYSDSRKLLENFGVVKDNKLTVSRSANGSEFSIATPGNGQNYARVSDKPFTNNVYLEASKIARHNGVTMIVPWGRSNPDLLTPGMSVELLYDHNGLINVISGTLIGHTSSYELEGTGPTAKTHRAACALVLFLDRNDPEYIAYLKAGGSISAVPEVGSI